MKTVVNKDIFFIGAAYLRNCHTIPIMIETAASRAYAG